MHTAHVQKKHIYMPEHATESHTHISTRFRRDVWNDILYSTVKMKNQLDNSTKHFDFPITSKQKFYRKSKSNDIDFRSLCDNRILWTLFNMYTKIHSPIACSYRLLIHVNARTHTHRPQQQTYTHLHITTPTNGLNGRKITYFSGRPYHTHTSATSTCDFV